MISWETVKEEFRFEGRWLDIYVRQASIEDWRAVYPMLRKCAGVKFRVNDLLQPLPLTVDEIFSSRPVGHPSISVLAGKATIIVHFFTEDEVECDLDPREFSSQSDLDYLLAFVQQLGDLTDKQVLVTAENMPEAVIFSYQPHTKQFAYHRAG